MNSIFGEEARLLAYTCDSQNLFQTELLDINQYCSEFQVLLQLQRFDFLEYSYMPPTPIKAITCCTYGLQRGFQQRMLHINYATI